MLIISKKYKKYLRFLIIGALTTATILSAGVYLYRRPQHLEVDFLDVGQGDSILIKSPYGQAILIDGGPDNSVLRCLGENLPFYRRWIDIVILSHYHDDHAIGLAEITKRYKIGKIFFSTGHSSPALEEITASAEAKKIPIYHPKVKIRAVLGPDCNLDIFNPESLDIPKDNNNSLVVKLDCQGKKFLFSGDNSNKVEKAIISSGFDLEAEVLKASHHGSNNSNSEDFLTAVNPHQLIVSVGSDNRFGHPGQDFLDRAAKLKIPVYRTDLLRTIRIFN